MYAADQFVIVAPRVDLRRQDIGDERTVIAGYHWFTDWGRDTMISLEGLTLVTGRHREARAILKTFAQHVRDGLIPNMFPEGESEGLYHTADATLWFFHAISRYEKYTGDESLVHELFSYSERDYRSSTCGERCSISMSIPTTSCYRKVLRDIS